MIDASGEAACAFKPNSAFFEAFGGEGFEALREVIAYVPDDIPVILDAKRGDISSTAEAYAKAAFEVLGATAITLNPYLGFDAVFPFLNYSGKGAFVLCKTSNPGADLFQDLHIEGKPLYEIVAVQVMQWNTANNVGLVVGATDIESLSHLRATVPKAWFLVPGIGAQGGDLSAAMLAGLRADGLGMLLNISRSLARATNPRVEALRMRDAINDARALRGAIQPPSPADQAEKLAIALAEAGCVKFGEFTLKSGKLSPIYLDLRRLVANPEALQTVGNSLAQLLKTLKFEHIAAIPYAALPIATAAALSLKCSMVYPRREVKDYGTKAAVEGVFNVGDRAVLVDDLASTGGTKFEAIGRLRSAGLVVDEIVVLIDRGQGAAELLSNAGYRFHAVATLRQLLPLWEKHGYLSTDQRHEVEAYLDSERLG
jgi:uridine monophosphate synthetase